MKNYYKLGWFLLFLIMNNRWMLGSPLQILSGMEGNSMVTIDKFTYGYGNLRIKEWGEGAPLCIGKFVSLAENITIFLGGDHHTEWISTYPFGHVYHAYLGGQEIKGNATCSKGGVTIGNDVWIGYSVTILSGVTIGNGAVIGACSVVVKNVEPYSIVAGNPAQHKKYRFDEETRSILQKLRWWDLGIEQIREILPSLCSTPDLETLKGWLKKYREEE
ncbi:MAG TPA: CatB-related O-acetyltransferase [Candidatus Saccharimonadales bacterium]|nr:CatB-related O-acetyltransferase [Candidatus Saccharimonadales bacterium]